MTGTTAPTWPDAMKMSRPPPGDAFTVVADWLGRLNILRILGAASNLGILFVVVAFWFDLEDRYRARTTQAWQLLTTEAPGNSGKIEALEYLNQEVRLFGYTFKPKQSLIGMDLSAGRGRPSVYLRGVQLPDAELESAELSFVDFFEANLANAGLADSDLSGANLVFANLDGADLTRANLTGADLYSATLANTNLTGANLSDARVMGRSVQNSQIFHTNISGAKLIAGFIAELDFGDGPEMIDLYGATTSARTGDIGFWAWSDQMPQVSDVADPIWKTFDDIKRLVEVYNQPFGSYRPLSLEEATNKLTWLTVCPAALRPQWEATGKSGAPPDCL